MPRRYGSARPHTATQGRPLPVMLMPTIVSPILGTGASRRRCAIRGWKKRTPQCNVIACRELQQAGSRGAQCTPNSPAACRATSVHTLQCGIDDGAKSSSLTTVTGMSEAQGTRRSTPAALGVCGTLEPGHNRLQASGSTSQPSTSRPSAWRHNRSLRVNLRVRRQASQRNVDTCLQTPMHVQSGCCTAFRAAWPSRAHSPVPYHSGL